MLCYAMTSKMLLVQMLPSWDIWQETVCLLDVMHVTMNQLMNVHVVLRKTPAMNIP